MVGNEHYTVNSASYIYDMKWELHSEQFKLLL